jgi:LmbE family N-acetylglucosaminyl deacetylase
MRHTNNILILAPHTDDGELGCGASVSKYVSQGKQVTYIAFSTCAGSLPAGLPADTLVTECRAAMQVLGIQQVRFFDFEVRHMPAHRQQILEELVKIQKEIQPQTVFLPAQHDVHQDHQVIFSEGMRAFKHCNVLGYELPWNNTRFQPNYFEDITAEQLKVKHEALHAYKSQQHKNYMRDEFIRSLAVVRGVQAHSEFAEAFEVYRMKG